MFEKQKFIKSVFNLNQLPKANLPSIILCGRSNVGKSSFINSLFNRKDLAKVSSTPGKTRSINFYKIDEKFYIIDLPGFGYAKTSIAERNKWAELINNFLSTASNIKCAFHFIDGRHKPTPLDLNLNQLLRQNNIPYIIILSKADKLKQSEIANAKKNIANHFPEVKLNSNVIFYSVVKPLGKTQIYNLLKELFFT